MDPFRNVSKGNMAYSGEQTALKLPVDEFGSNDSAASEQDSVRLAARWFQPDPDGCGSRRDAILQELRRVRKKARDRFPRDPHYG